ncbi:hypothetical protein E5S70_07350 [Ensifer adhaerens]|uniref:hypothetical protein n=1 Tax=Ensifer canadensis TaxID=555315 RepID=UPI00148FFE4C|nr:hypothetical protein [Ensifer canadensis]NOV15901.1 hypothetical protein [Ensifer canadensis]
MTAPVLTLVPKVDPAVHAAVPNRSTHFLLTQLAEADITADQRQALISCLVHPTRQFGETAEAHGLTREKLQDLFFDLFINPRH